jgi:hypothetical protein
MNSSDNSFSQITGFELRFQSLFNAGRGFAFPCDAAGQVDMNQLSDRARDNYLCARALIGRDYSSPTLEPAWQH